jgi:hypothetical protein
MPHLKTVLHHPPRQNSVNFAPPSNSNSQSANDLQRARGAIPAEFRSTRKRKKFCWVQNSGGRGSKVSTSGRITPRCAKQCGGSFAHLRQLPSESGWPRRKRACQIDLPATAGRQWRTLGRKRKASFGKTRLRVTARRQVSWLGPPWPAGNR